MYAGTEVLMRSTIALALVLSLACTSVPRGPQSVRGTVADNAGMPLPGVTVTLHKPSGDLVAVTDARGQYSLPPIAAGTYRLEMQLAGFNSESVTISVASDRAPALETRMRVAAVAESITVTASAPLGRSDIGVIQPNVAREERRRVPASAPMPVQVNAAARRSSIVDSIHRTPNYATIQEHDYIRTVDEKTTTFSIDVDGASYTNVRRYLNANLVPPPDAVRIEEMLNYFTYNYAQPSDGSPVAVSAEVAGCPWEPSHRLMRIGIQAKSVDSWKLAPNRFVFLLDVSGSMQPPERLPLIKSAMRLLVDQLRPIDSVAIVVYAGASGLALPPTSDKTQILAALDRLNAGGSTAGGAGIELAYKTAQDNFEASANNRVILATDGDFNVGVTGIGELAKLIEEKRKSGIYLTCIGVGTDNLNDALMESLADKGDGNYYYLDNINEGKRVFVTQLQGTLVTVANDVKVQLEFNAATVAEYRQIGYEDRAMANQDFDDDAKDAGEIGSGHAVTALYEIVPRGSGTMATLRLRYKEPPSHTSKLMTTTIADTGKSSYEASPDMQFATAVAEFGMLLRNSKHKGSATYADVLALARAMRGPDTEGYREEFLRMVEAGRTIMGETPTKVAGQ